MSRNKDKIEKALNRKGYQSTYMSWDCGPAGGWYITFEVMPDMKSPTSDDEGTIVGYSIAEVLEEIEELPVCTLDEDWE
ncbi:MAG: hypothetical protein N2376_02390 [Clostridia bacterium]|nr:hypothetical protein [Clostridia bacterium]